MTTPREARDVSLRASWRHATRTARLEQNVATTTTGLGTET